MLNVILHAYVLCSLVPLWARAECKKAPVLIQHSRRIKNLSICHNSKVYLREGSDEVNTAELPSMNQVLWSANVSYLVSL